MPRIFISYRRVDSRLVANRIYDRLVDSFGKRNIFKDVDSIPPGRDFRGVIRVAAAECRVMLVIIGPTWVDVVDAKGNRRLDNPDDFVRIEVETGIQRDDILVIPVLVEGVSMPRPEQLPDSLKELAFKNAFTLHDDPLFHRDMDILIQKLPIRTRPKWWFPPWLAGLSAFLLIALGVIVLQPHLNPQTPTPTLTTMLELTSTPTNTTIPIGFTGNPVTSNIQWKPYINQYERQFDGVDMVLVPSGCFQMGDASDSNVGGGGKQCFNQPFWIDRYEVTNEQFNLLGGQSGLTSSSTGDKEPRGRITWSESHDFCQQKRGGFLPTEAEWEYAARGPDDLLYPWGNYWYDGIVVSGRAQPADVGSRRGDVSWVGVDDMTGNVMEWVSTIYDGFAYPYATDDGRESIIDNNAHVIRGGMSGNSLLMSFRITYRHAGNPDYWFGDLGFRCARSYQPGDIDP